MMLQIVTNLRRIFLVSLMIPVEMKVALSSNSFELLNSSFLNQIQDYQMGSKKKKKLKKTREAISSPSEEEYQRPPKLNRKYYEKELEKLQGELVQLQRWVLHKGLRVVILFEGRDAAGKGGIIKRITERVSPRVFRVVALPAPSDRENSQLYMQRYFVHMPAAGEVIIFDRSWYNRAGIEHVLGFCTQREYQRFIQNCTEYERALVDDGIILIKYWVSVGNEEQARRFKARIEQPIRQWKLSPTDLESRRLWYQYSRARDAMFDATDTKLTPWHLIRSNDKRRARLNCISHLLSHIPYEVLPTPKVEIPERETDGAYDDVGALEIRNWIPEVY